MSKVYVPLAYLERGGGLRKFERHVAHQSSGELHRYVATCITDVWEGCVQADDFSLSDFLSPLQPPTPPYPDKPPHPDKPPRPSHPRGLDFGPFRLRFGSVWAPFRVRFGSVWVGLGWGLLGLPEYHYSSLGLPRRSQV